MASITTSNGMYSPMLCMISNVAPPPPGADTGSEPTDRTVA